MQRKSLNDLVKKTANPFQFLFLPGTTQDPIQTKKQILLFKVGINRSLDHCSISCLEPDQTLPILLSKCRSSLQTQKEHLQKVLYIVHYLSSTTDLCICYSSLEDKNGFITCSNMDWGGDIETSQSTTGYTMFLANRIISWLS